MSEAPDDLHRLIHETLSELGWEADPVTIAERVRRLDIGLPVEDEFAVVCSWLGKCDLLHKLDQHQLPLSSRDTYQVPDALALFSTQTVQRPILIEVKNKNKNVLSFTPDYLSRLNNYADLLGMPLLIAWKFHSLWILFEARHLKQARKNFNISYGEAMKENLMGVLTGDIAYKIGPGAGIHFRAQKEELLSVIEAPDEKTEEWMMRFTEVFFTDRDGNHINKLSSDIQALFTTWDLESKEEHANDHIWMRFVAGEDGLQFGHTALVRLLDWRKPTDVKLSWRREARKKKLNTIEDIRRAVAEALDDKIVSHVFHQVPHSMPSFLPTKTE